MSIRKPASFTAGRKVTVGGTTYQPGDAVPNATVKALPRLSAMLSNGMIVSNLDLYARKTKAKTHQPTAINSSMRAGL